MNMFFKFPLCMTVVTIMATSMISCSDNNNGSNTSNGLSDEEQALKEAIVPYVDNKRFIRRRTSIKRSYRSIRRQYRYPYLYGYGRRSYSNE